MIALLFSKKLSIVVPTNTVKYLNAHCMKKWILNCTLKFQLNIFWLDALLKTNFLKQIIKFCLIHLKAIMIKLYVILFLSKYSLFYVFLIEYAIVIKFVVVLHFFSIFVLFIIYKFKILNIDWLIGSILLQKNILNCF